MKLIQISPGITLHLAPDYAPPPLPMYLPWIEALESGCFKRGQGYLKKRVERITPRGLSTSVVYCPLGVLAEIQQRLRKDAHNIDLYRDAPACELRACTEYLSKQNPLFPFIGRSGRLPLGAVVHSDKILWKSTRFISCMSDAGFTFRQVATVIKHCWKQEDDMT